jgi:O-antigen ligase
MSRLVHNDYLEQASDSGLPGAVLYLSFIASSLVYTRPRRLLARDGRTDSGLLMHFAVWLGVLGWAVQGFLEFGLYLPALAWPAFALVGMLLGRTANPMDNALPGR